MKTEDVFEQIVKDAIPDAKIDTVESVKDEFTNQTIYRVAMTTGQRAEFKVKISVLRVSRAPKEVA